MFQDLGLEVDYDGTDADLEELPNAEFQAMEEAEDVSTGDVPLVTFTPDEDKRDHDRQDSSRQSEAALRAISEFIQHNLHKTPRDGEPDKYTTIIASSSCL
ncbi:hypothetical protein BDV98DRAFT_594598 [Pterulicium gracile]|uniref:Uncharacterized protein n=1 Tax=Pterulicium gracile TaxID=1884261 RepID=A0A5C3QMP6_9AGAR|nr:hypothetical protein BDV98DRAFT_594598 [Pterula gracilis]